MTMIALDQLDPHPGNANRMPPPLLAKLVEHIRATGHYPAIIVRPQGDASGRYQILDGHHRAEALRRLGHAQAACEVWDVDDEQASLLLLTLNRLRGEDDPLRRAELLKMVAERMGLEELARRVPEDVAHLRQVLALAQPLTELRPPPRVEEMPQAVTFFLNAGQRRALLGKLRAVSEDRSAALVQLLRLDSVS